MMFSKKYFDEILDSIEDDDMYEFADKLLETIPKYVYEVSASSTGKFHPDYTKGEGGLARHTCAVVRLLNYTFQIECMNHWSKKERDILRIAAMMHDSRKSGSQEDYERNKYTKHEHPLLAAEVVRSVKGCGIISDSDIELIAQTIESHMGQWNVSDHSPIVLPKPETELQKMLHWADYLASRKDIEIQFEIPKNTKNISVSTADWKFPFGKYKNMTFDEVLDYDKSYLIWLRDKASMDIREPLKSFLNNMP